MGMSAKSINALRKMLSSGDFDSARMSLVHEVMIRARLQARSLLQMLLIILSFISIFLAASHHQRSSARAPGPGNLLVTACVPHAHLGSHKASEKGLPWRGVGVWEFSVGRIVAPGSKWVQTRDNVGKRKMSHWVTSPPLFAQTQLKQNSSISPFAHAMGCNMLAELFNRWGSAAAQYSAAMMEVTTTYIHRTPA
jgi:hypothetical protein